MKTDVADFTEQFKRCLMNEPTFCTAACPFGLDVRVLTEKIRQGQLAAAYRLYRDATCFPGIVSRLCDHPCAAVCPLGSLGEGSKAIDLPALEAHLCAEAKDLVPNAYALPPRRKSVAVLGAGLSGMACALRLAEKKYHVEIFEAGDDLCAGGRAKEASPSISVSEIKFQFQKETYIFHARQRIQSRAEINGRGFSAVYVSTGKNGEDFGLLHQAEDASGGGLPGKRPCLLDPFPHQMDLVSVDSTRTAAEAASGAPNDAEAGMRGGLSDLTAEAGIAWLAGGALTGRNGAHAIADGIAAAAAIDAFLRTGALVWTQPARETKLPLDPAKLEAARTAAQDAKNPEEADEAFALREAVRCLGCRCDACMTYCDLPAYTHKWPPRIRDEVFATTLPGKAEVKATPAKRLINLDNLSGVFAEICPAHIDMDALLLAGRRSMHRQEKMPWAFHEFWLRDMAHANGKTAALVLDTRLDSCDERPFEASEALPMVFFPGCQLGAGLPALVHAAWLELRELEALGQIKLSGMLLRCCGAPAEWAGDEALTDEACGELRRLWEALGAPVFVCACPSCMRFLAERLPEIETRSLYEVLPPLSRQVCGQPTDKAPQADWAIFDPCAAARLPDKNKAFALRESVRSHAKALGLAQEPLPVQERIPRCCGFGGQPECADPNFVRTVRESRAAESDLPYLCYCINCREAFLQIGKPSAHILELRYADRTSGAHAPTLSPSARRANREALHRTLLGARQTDAPPEPGDFRLLFSDGVESRMDEDRILTEDVYAVVAHSLQTGQCVYSPKTGAYSASLMIGRTTYWVCYLKALTPRMEAPATAFPTLTVCAVYAHRLAIEREVVWAGIPQTGEMQAEAPDALHCAACKLPLAEMEASFTYLGRSFRHKTLRCPACGFVYIPETLARGRMREVEMALEDK